MAILNDESGSCVRDELNLSVRYYAPICALLSVAAYMVIPAETPRLKLLAAAWTASAAIGVLVVLLRRAFRLGHDMLIVWIPGVCLTSFVYLTLHALTLTCHGLEHKTCDDQWQCAWQTQNTPGLFWWLYEYGGCQPVSRYTVSGIAAAELSMVLKLLKAGGHFNEPLFFPGGMMPALFFLYRFLSSERWTDHLPFWMHSLPGLVPALQSTGRTGRERAREIQRRLQEQPQQQQQPPPQRAHQAPAAVQPNCVLIPSDKTKHDCAPSDRSHDDVNGRRPNTIHNSKNSSGASSLGSLPAATIRNASPNATHNISQAISFSWAASAHEFTAIVKLQRLYRAHLAQRLAKALRESIHLSRICTSRTTSFARQLAMADVTKQCHAE